MSNPISSLNNALNGGSKFTKLYNNPNFDYLSEMLPKDIKDLFKWAELVYNNAPIITNGVKKLINYPLTDFVYKTDSEEVREQTKDLVEKKLKLRPHLINLGVDYYTYGNAFRSIYFPFDRYLRCRTCGTEVNIRKANYKLRDNKIVLSCACGVSDYADIEDKQSDDLSKIKLIAWDPKQLDLVYNPITGDTTYYYTLPGNVIKGIANKEEAFLNTIPKMFLDAHEQKRDIKLGANFYHHKAPGLSGYAVGWGISPLMPALKPYLYVSILRKASEAIGLEHITPQRILFPQASSNDPTVTTNLAKWQEHVSKAVEKWRRDPNYVMTAPHPTGVINIGSQGRGLMPTQEIREANQEMALAMDLPPDFIYGNGGIEKNTVSLRILENQLTPYVEQIIDYANWVIKLINAKYGKSYCEIDLTPFTLADDTMKTQMLMQTAGNLTSQRTFMEAVGLDPDEEHDKLKQEQIEAHNRGKEVEKAIVEQDQNIAQQTQDEAVSEATGSIPEYNQQKLMAHAQQLAQQFIMIPYEERRSQMDQLQNEDYVMWAMVSKMVEAMHDRQETQQ